MSLPPREMPVAAPADPTLAAPPAATPDPTPAPRPDPHPDPHRPADDAARAMARQMLDAARDAVLAVLDRDGWPQTSRIGVQIGADGMPLALLSGLALHSKALMRDPRAALLIDAPAGRGAALARARLSLQVRAVAVAGDDAALRAAWRANDPKAAVYLGLPDFRFWRLHVQSGLLNAGFGRAHLLRAADLTAGPPQG